MIVTSKNQQLNTGSSLYFDDASIGFSSAMNLFVVSVEPLNSLMCKFKTGDVFKTYTIDVNDVVVVEDQLILVDITPVVQGGYNIYKLNLMFNSEAEAEFNDELTIEYQSATTQKSLTISVYCNAIGLQVETSIALQNLKRVITAEWMQAMYDTEFNAGSIDFIIYNRKVREYLMTIFDLDALKGSYKGLFAALEFFGYGDLLDLKEYWLSIDGTYKSTSIKNAVLLKIEKSLIGYKKTNQMSLTYQINEQQSVDDDGLPVYINVLDKTDEILFKLWTLERILEQEFMFMNTHIVDIVGEFQSVIGLELQAILNDLQVIDVNLSNESTTELTVEFGEDIVFIQRHNVYTNETFAYDPGNPELLRVPGATSGSHSATYFDVQDIVDSLANSADEYRMLTKFYADDFGLIELKITTNLELYQSFRYILLDESGNELFMSNLKSIGALSSGFARCGVKVLGQYKFLVYLFDYYGGYSVASSDSIVTVTTQDVDFYIGAYGQGLIRHDIKMWTTFRDTTAISVRPTVDTISETLNINNWNQDINFPAMQVSRYYESDFDMLSTWTNLNQLNSIKLSSMQGIPLHVHGYTYTVFINDLIGDGSAGNRLLRLKLFQDKPYETVQLMYNGTDDPIVFIQQFINLINQLDEDSIFSKFIFDVHMYSNNPAALISEARPMLRAKGKESSFKKFNYIVEFDDQYAHTDMLDAGFVQDLRIFSKIDASVKIPFIQSALDDLVILFDDAEFTAENLQVDSLQDIYDEIIALIADFEIKGLYCAIDNDLIHLYGSSDMKISHASFGSVNDVYRGVLSTDIVKIPLGSDIRLGEPVFAFIDSDRRMNLANITWVLLDTLTGEVVTTQHAYAFRWVMSRVGVYSLQLHTTDIGGDRISTKHGCYVVTESIQNLSGISIDIVDFDFIVQ